MLARRRSGGRGYCRYVGMTGLGVSSSGAKNITLPAGSAAGQLCVIVQCGNSAPISFPSGFTTIALGTMGGVAQQAAYKVLTSTDITNGYVTLPAGTTNAHAFVLGVYEGPVTASLASSVTEGPSAGSDTTIPGFSPNADSLGFAGVVVEGFNSGVGTHDFPSPWSDRGQQTQTGNIASLHDLTDVGAYTGGNILVTGLSNLAVIAGVLELKAA